MHWNANSIDKQSQPIEELENFIKNNKIHIIGINETKLQESDEINLKDYNIIRKDRNQHGGGVAIIIDKQLQYDQLNTFEEFELELLAIKVNINNIFYTFLTLYLPPQVQFPEEAFFVKLATTNNLILCGDLNCKSKAWFSKKNNQNGVLLQEIIEKHNLTIIHNK